MQKQIICAHLLNDFSGSPRVLSQALEGMVQAGYSVDLYSANHPTGGFLSGITGLRCHPIRYKSRSPHELRLFPYLWSQFILFFSLLKYARKDVVFYVNTLLPFGAALAGLVLRKRVIYHIHQTEIKPNWLRNGLVKIAGWSASDVVYVSRYLKSHDPLPNARCHIVYSGLSRNFIQRAAQSIRSRKRPDFRVLMICSLHDYKGVKDFVQLARMLEEIQFDLVLNTRKSDIEAYFRNYDLPDNLHWHPGQTNMHPFYERASLVVNLSHPDKLIETFGLTILEGMNYRLPSIVPPVGGITELVEDGFNGYKTDVRELEYIKDQIKLIHDEPRLYRRLASNAGDKAREFDVERMQSKLLDILRN